MTHCLVRYMAEDRDLSEYSTFSVSTETDHTSLTEILILLNQLARSDFVSMPPMLSVNVDGSLSMFCLHTKSVTWRVDMWTRGNDIDNGVWPRSTRVVKLNVPRPLEFPHACGLMRRAAYFPSRKNPGCAKGRCRNRNTGRGAIS